MTTDVITQTTTKISFPNFYNVVLHNDDFTPMDFVISLLIEFFGKDQKEAEKITVNIHHNGRGIAGSYTLEIAEQKKTESLYVAQQFGFPLRVSVEKQ